MTTLAIDGGTPVRGNLLPYGRQSMMEDDINAVKEILLSDWLTTGPKVGEFENAFAQKTNVTNAIAVSSGTAALHAMMYAANIQEGDEVIVPTMTFASTANAVVFQKGIPVFCDCNPDTLLIDIEDAKKKITQNTKAIIVVDYTGQPCDYDALQLLCEEHDLLLLSDACHSLGGSFKERPVGSLADMSAFSFHPVKPMTTGEGGMVTTNNKEYAQRMRRFRNHCLTSDHRERQEEGSWFYEMTDLGYNYRLTDIQCSLGLSQLKKLDSWTQKRQEIAKTYDDAFTEIPANPLHVRDDVFHAYHLYVVQLSLESLSQDRSQVFKALRKEGIGVNVHYIPVHLHPYYREHFGTKEGICPQAEGAYTKILSVPLFPQMQKNDVIDVIKAFKKVLGAYAFP